MKQAALVILVAAACCGAYAQGMPSFGLLGDLPLLQEGRGMRASSCDPNWKDGNGDARPIPPGETLTIADLEGPGVIRHIWNTIAAQEYGYSRLVVIRIYWDGEKDPSVEVPLGDFFGVGHGLDRPMDSLPVCVTSSGRARNCYWPMPFRKHAAITVTNEGRQPVNAFFWYVDWIQVPSLPDNAGYFHAMYRQEHPAVMGRNYLIADIEGRGQYVGTLLNVRQHTPSWWGEGDDFFFIDGEEAPSLRGTGSEDYLCDAWGLRKISGLFYGVPIMEGYEPYARTTAYRWHVADPVPFTTSLRVEIEHKGVAFNEDGSMRSGFEERADDFSSVAYWYQQEPHKPFPAMDPPYDRVYFDPANVFEIEQMLDETEASAGPVSLQEGMWGGQGQIFWMPGIPDQTLDVPFEIDEAGAYEMVLFLTYSWDYGIFDVLIDGEAAATNLDLLSDSVVVKEHCLAPRPLDKGRHVLTFKNKGKNPGSKGYFFGLDSILLQKEKG